MVPFAQSLEADVDRHIKAMAIVVACHRLHVVLPLETLHAVSRCLVVSPDPARKACADFVEMLKCFKKE